jgi:hypothetical protein
MGIEIESKVVRHVFYISLIFYLWYLASTLLLPLSDFLPLPEGFYITVYTLANFPVSILGFIVCVSIMSSIIAFKEFQEKGPVTKLLLTDGISFMLYFIIPIIATVLLLTLIVLKLTVGLPSELRITYFLEDLFMFTTALFLLTSVLNVATERILGMGKCCATKKSRKKLE